MADFLIAIGFVVILVIVLWRLKKFKKKYLEPIFMVIFLFGIFSLCQPYIFALYRHGFTILLTGTFGYIGAIHFK